MDLRQLLLLKELFLWTLPVWIVGTFVFNTYVLMEAFQFRALWNGSGFSPFSVWNDRDMRLPFVGIVVYWFLLLNAGGSISYCWYLSCFHAKRFLMPSRSIAPPPRTVMQVDPFTAARPPSNFPRICLDGGRPNRCDHRGDCLNALAWRGDRMYHCRHGYNRCLPVFDHYCYWLWTPVYLNTIKPYCLFMPLIFLYQLFCLVALCWTMSSPHVRGLSRWFIPLIVVSASLTALLAVNMIMFQWNMIVIQNRVGKERGREWRWRMAIRDIEGRLMEDEPEDNPYSLGSWRANAQEVLGKWHQMPFWFWQPARVHQYADHWNLDCDTTISPAYMIRANSLRNVGLNHLPPLPPLTPLPPPPPRGLMRRRHNASSLV
ncbi:DHHC zinc finger domain-containing protein [Colletotrichum zoysiae]|uniref:Palmitoyltransferase n=1 Tax=Colletotrichum zoysiae TaxID=1216348 RepID=A0AAD9HW32_9PEZI|nr:DHHC zinc finger domain-containing protein [Colletotrichum zoysiae]